MIINLKSLSAGWLALTITASVLSPAWAGGDGSDGHSHGPTAPVLQASANTALPRLSSQTELFELVGTLEGQVLTLYLDRFDTNVPVEKAEIEVTSGSWKATAQEIAPAVYRVSADWLSQPGRYPLTLTVLAGEATDLMEATLEVGAPVAASTALQPGYGSDQWRIWSAAAVLALAGMALWLVRARRRHRQH